MNGNATIPYTYSDKKKKKRINLAKIEKNCSSLLLDRFWHRTEGIEDFEEIHKSNTRGSPRDFHSVNFTLKSEEFSEISEILLQQRLGRSWRWKRWKGTSIRSKRTEASACVIFNGFLEGRIDAADGQQQILPGEEAAASLPERWITSFLFNGVASLRLVLVDPLQFRQGTDRVFKLCLARDKLRYQLFIRYGPRSDRLQAKFQV